MQNNFTEEKLREEFNEIFPDLKWSTTGGTCSIADYGLKVLAEYKAFLRGELEKIKDNKKWTITVRDQAINDAINLIT